MTGRLKRGDVELGEVGRVGDIWFNEVKGHGVLDALSLGVARAGKVIDSDREDAPASSGSKSDSSADSSSLSMEASRSEICPEVDVRDGEREDAGGVVESSPLADILGCAVEGEGEVSDELSEADERCRLQGLAGGSSALLMYYSELGSVEQPRARLGRSSPAASASCAPSAPPLLHQGDITPSWSSSQVSPNDCRYAPACSEPFERARAALAGQRASSTGSGALCERRMGLQLTCNCC